MRIGAILKKWRVVSDLELKEVAQEIGIGESALRRLEGGTQKPDAQNILKMIHWLFMEEPNGDSENSQHGPESSGEKSGDEIAVGKGK